MMKFVKFEDIPDAWKTGAPCLFRYETKGKKPEHYIAHYEAPEPLSKDTGWIENRSPIKVYETKSYDIYAALIIPYSDEPDEVDEADLL